jgi:hypothetical protein
LIRLHTVVAAVLYERDMRTIRHVLDNNLSELSRKIVLVPLDDTISPLYATIYEETFWELVSHGCSDFWYLNKDNTPVLYTSLLGYPVSVPRLIMKAGPGIAVRFIDRDKHNLRTTNLYLTDLPSAKRREWDFIVPNTKDAIPRCQHLYEYSRENYWKKGIDRMQEQRKQQQLQQEKHAWVMSLFPAAGVV